ncbi:MAG: HTH domain-containing protein [Acidobacteria bacterium]|nr:HTH domain-containing protein [Acidobacteriota bacterium]
MKTTERLLAMAELLKGSRRWRTAALAEELGVSERTVYRDIGRLEAARLPVVRDDEGYRLLDALRPRAIALTLDEHALLATALDQVAFRTIPGVGEKVDRLLEKLSPGFDHEPPVEIAGRSGAAAWSGT